jgi:peptidoglycan hydrolase CwlO-like protein
MDMAIITGIISAAAALSGIILGWLAHGRAAKEAAKKEGSSDAELKTDVKYIKSSVDKIDKKMEEANAKITETCERVARLEAKDKEQDRRLADLEAKVNG